MRLATSILILLLTGVPNAPTVELAPESRQAYLDLRAGIEHDQEMIYGLQEYVRTLGMTEPK